MLEELGSMDNQSPVFSRGAREEANKRVGPLVLPRLLLLLLLLPRSLLLCRAGDTPPAVSLEGVKRHFGRVHSPFARLAITLRTPRLSERCCEAQASSVQASLTRSSACPLVRLVFLRGKLSASLGAGGDPIRSGVTRADKQTDGCEARGSKAYTAVEGFSLSAPSLPFLLEIKCKEGDSGSGQAVGHVST